MLVDKLKRTNHCGDLTIKDLNKEVWLIGWVSKKRNLGSLLFVDLRDRYGIVQILIKTDEIEVPEIRNEYLLNVRGIVRKKDVPNKNLKTGEIEIEASEIILINKSEQPPLIIADETDALEDVRLKYRYLDLRRPVMQKRFITRAKIVKAVHEYLDAHDFIEVETPILTLSTPEGARDYLVPSRVHKGSFYALPQSPQLFKQLLMVAGFERYYQIAKCFRDEDLRSDRQPDFTQIDIETSFLNEDEILTLTEGLIAKIYKDVINYDVKLPLRRISYDEAVNTYGSDKPDTRFDLKLVDIKDILINNEDKLFKDNKYIKCFKIENVANETSRKVQDNYNLTAKKFKLNSYIYLKFLNNELEGSITKFLSNDEKNALINRLSLKENDLVVIAVSNVLRNVNFGLGAIRSELAKKYHLIQDGTFDILWVVNFPLFEKSEETGEITPCHHPFTRPVDEDLDKLETEPYKVYSYTYDIVMNGFEAGGGGLRIYDQETQERIFKVLGFSEEDIQRKFGFFVDALKYGTPPHGGLAFGLDRLTMILSGTDNIRDVIAFPKNLSAVCPMTNAPRPVDDAQLKELGIKVVEKEKVDE
ncbi:MAG: aspartate--tRNA ligase [Firmicutes bacterium]|uniref:Aspartate--tRNA ligase n=1 Tax=Candidatus Onthovivens merdipullorum TaxID=2840889 RepID=A0A9D9DGG9_9BACL|nr:aspartate--tRNA ligase [Candidatus Onthovivens merdipullorum]